MNPMKTLAILVGGGPAPGINAVIAAATIEARNHGLRVLGCYDGFKWLVQGDTQHVVDLEINDTSRIHFDGGSIIRTSRTNPSKSAEAIRQVGDALQRLGVNHLITIGGDDPAYSASRLAKTVPGLTVAQVPKTIDTALPLPGDIAPFGSPTACNLGKELVRNLMQDAQTTERWFFITVMGRHAGHLALGIGGSAAATLTLIAEEFPEPQISLDRLADTLEGAIIKRRVQGREHGVAILSEGLGRQQRDGDDPGRPPRAHSLRPHGRSQDRQGARALRGRRVRDVPDAVRLHDPPQARGLHQPRSAGRPRQGRQPLRDRAARPLRPPRRARLSARRRGGLG